MSRAAQLEFARRIALRLLDIRQRTERELRDAMAKKQVPEDVADEVLARFVEVGLVNDEAFAAALVTTRSQVSLRGRASIRQELQRKGVDREVATGALAELDREDERETAAELARRKVRSMSRLAPEVARRRLYGVLARRGYSGDIVRDAVDRAMGEWPADDGLASGEA